MYILQQAIRQKGIFKTNVELNLEFDLKMTAAKLIFKQILIIKLI
jgi:hypothetical protein